MASSTASNEHTKRVSIAAGILAALAASSCCLGPLLVAVLGLGGAGVFAKFATYRPHFLAVTGAFLGLAFYLSYRRPKTLPADACGCNPTASKTPRLVLWSLAVVTILVAVSPSVLARMSARHGPDSLLGRASTATIQVDGIDCEACAAPIRKALIAAGGFEDMKLDVASQQVTVSYDPGPGRPNVYVKAIGDLGYEARLSSVADTKKDAQ